mmetsp:Transcript_43566/g.100352  ORF Transcript_43566/g.100352 Transcript_43566/m.100352 type:complete len:837 (-) Transcript_43566:143-2653(-)
MPPRQQKQPTAAGQRVARPAGINKGATTTASARMADDDDEEDQHPLNFESAPLQASKKAKKEAYALDPPTPARAVRSANQEPFPDAAVDAEEPAAKRPRHAPPKLIGESDKALPPQEQLMAASQSKLFQARVGHSSSNGSSSSGAGKSSSLAWAVSTVKVELEALDGLEDVPVPLRELPECILVGGVAARRELVAALLGDNGYSTQLAAALIHPQMKQPVAIELRGAEDAVPPQGQDVEQYVRSITQATQAGLGNKLKMDPLNLRISLPGCTNIDIVDLPNRNTASGMVHPRVEEMRAKYLGSSCNLLVCLEPAFLELCRRHDPRAERTIVLGAAAGAGQSGDHLPPSTLCGPQAAKGLEERFMSMCTQRLHLWLSGISALDTRLAKAQVQACKATEEESAGFLLRRARDVGISFGRAFQHVISGTPGCDAGALTLEEELNEFAVAATKLECGLGATLSSEGAAAAAAEVWSAFGGVQGYTNFLRTVIEIPGADLPLNGGAAWQRLLLEIEVAMRLARPSKEELAGLHLASVQAGGTGVRGHQLWEDVFEKLLREIAFEPLRRRVRYVAARIGWSLRQQKIAVADWMATLEDGRGRHANVYARQFSPLFPQHLAVLRSSAMTRELVFGAHDLASDKVAFELLRDIEGTLTAGCVNPALMMRPNTQPELKEGATRSQTENGSNGTGSSGGRSGGGEGSKLRVKSEMTRRSGRSGGLPTVLQQRVYDSKEAIHALPCIELQLRTAFRRLTNVLTHQAYAFADTALNSLCRVHLDEAINSIDFTPEQARAITKRHSELLNDAKQVEKQITALRRCAEALKGVTPTGLSVEGSSRQLGGL